jgi:hypothetical protein
MKMVTKLLSATAGAVAILVAGHPDNRALRRGVIAKLRNRFPLLQTTTVEDSEEAGHAVARELQERAQAAIYLAQARAHDEKVRLQQKTQAAKDRVKVVRDEFKVNFLAVLEPVFDKGVSLTEQPPVK